MKRRLEKEKKNVLYGAADEILLEETKQYKVMSPTRSLSITIVSKILPLVFYYVRFSDCQIGTKKVELPYLLRKERIKLGNQLIIR